MAGLSGESDRFSLGVWRASRIPAWALTDIRLSLAVSSMTLFLLAGGISLDGTACGSLRFFQLQARTRRLQRSTPTSNPNPNHKPTGHQHRPETANPRRDTHARLSDPVAQWTARDLTPALSRCPVSYRHYT